MAMAWSAAAKARILAGGCRLEPRVYVDVEQDGTGVYGVQVIDITDYVLSKSRIERSTSAIESSWDVKPVTVTVRNEDVYFTPNLMSGARDKVVNIWRTRPSGEASPRLCRVYIKMKVWLADGTTEEVQIYRGKIVNLNPMISGKDVVCEIETRDDFLDCLDSVLPVNLGGVDYAPGGDGLPAVTPPAWPSITPVSLPATDPYRMADVSFESLSDTSGDKIDGLEYNRLIGIANGSIFTRFVIKIATSPYLEMIPVRVHRYWGYVTTFGFLKFTQFGSPGFGYHAHWDPVPSGSYEYWVVNPLTYIKQWPSAIILGAIHWAHGMPEANIDIPSFAATNTWCDGNGILRSVCFFGETTISVIKKLCEQSWQIFIYVNGQEQLACGYWSHQPSDTPDWTINSGEYLRILKFSEMRLRKVPGIVQWGWHCEHQPCQKPGFGLFSKDVTTIFTSKEMTLESPYEARYVDDYMDDTGVYEDFADYVELEMEVGAIAFLVDLDEIVQVNEALLALGIDSDFQENFRAHKIILDCEKMTGIITMVKKKSWNIS